MRFKNSSAHGTLLPSEHLAPLADELGRLENILRKLASCLLSIETIAEPPEGYALPSKVIAEEKECFIESAASVVASSEFP
jgi:hypothetical protein